MSGRKQEAHLMATNKLARNRVRQMIYAVLAALLCFIGPTYLAALLTEFIPSTFAMALGFVSVLLGVFLLLRLVKD